MDKIKIYRYKYFFPESLQKLAYGGIIPNIKKNPLLLFQVPFFVFFQLVSMTKIISKEKIDVIHSHWIIPQGFCGAIIKKIHKKKHLMTIHAGGIFALKKLPFKRAVANFIVKNCDAITVVSSLNKKVLLEIISPNLRKNTEEKIKILPMGVSVKGFKKKSEEDKKELNILFIGRLAEKKGVKYLLDAMPKVFAEKPMTRLFIAGDGPLKEKLEKQVKELKITENVVFEGYVSGKNKLNAFSKADLVVVPSIIDKLGDQEGMPVTVLEGFASGSPVIASNVGGIADVIDNGINGFLVEQKNSNQIAEKILLLINSPNLRRKLRINALNTIKKYDWKEIGKKYYSLITSL